jgi:DNA-directed RNA polymerase specialized sigma24 family protein
MKIEIEQYIQKEYYKLLIICKKYTKNDDWASELLHEVILQILERQQLKLKLDDNSIKSYIIRCIMVNWCYPSSPFYRKYKRDMKHVEITEALHLVSEDSNFDKHKFLDIMEEEFSDVNWFNRLIFEKYLTLGSLKKVAMDTTISLPSISRYVNETKKQVRINTFKRFNNE